MKINEQSTATSWMKLTNTEQKTLGTVVYSLPDSTYLMFKSRWNLTVVLKVGYLGRWKRVVTRKKGSWREVLKMFSFSNWVVFIQICENLFNCRYVNGHSSGWVILQPFKNFSEQIKMKFRNAFWPMSPSCPSLPHTRVHLGVTGKK